MKALMVLMGLILATPGLHAAEKKFECSVDIFTGSQPRGSGWAKDVQTLNVSVPIRKVIDVINGADLNTVIPLTNGLEIVFELTWRSGQIGPDDVSVIPKPELTLTSRLQKRSSSGDIKILDMESVTSTEENPHLTRVVKKIFINQLLHNTESYSQVLTETKKPHLTEYDLDRAGEQYQLPFLYSLDCSTDL